MLYVVSLFICVCVGLLALAAFRRGYKKPQMCLTVAACNLCLGLINFFLPVHNPVNIAMAAASAIVGAGCLRAYLQLRREEPKE